MRFGFLLAILLVAITADAAKQSALPNRFGAIAYHRASQSWGTSFDKARERDASVEALKQCGNRECEVVHKFKNGCAALADGPKAFAASSGATRDEAETKALKRCGAGCKTIAWACTR
jgi:serine/threonine-protein kinase